MRCKTRYTLEMVMASLVSPPDPVRPPTAGADGLSAALTAPAEWRDSTSRCAPNFGSTTTDAPGMNQRCVCCGPKTASLRRQNSRCLDRGANFGVEPSHAAMSGAVFAASSRLACCVYTAPPVMAHSGNIGAGPRRRPARCLAARGPDGDAPGR